MSPISLDKIMKHARGVGSKPILHNKYVLYFILAVTLLNLFFAALKMDYLYCVAFILVGFITSFFTKNMIVILATTLAVANIIKVVVRGEPEFEGMETQTDEKKEEEKKDEVVASDDDSKKDEKKMVTELKSDAEELIDAQQKIIAGFDNIEPYMKKAETLISEIDKTAKKIEGLRSGVSSE